MNVQWPYMKFRHLAAANFTFTRRLRVLWLVNCGIETIDVNTFYAIGHTLRAINLNQNKIRSLSFDMLSMLYESTSDLVTFGIKGNNYQLACTCQLMVLNILMCPFCKKTTASCIECYPLKPLQGFTAASCGIHRDIVLAKFCIKWMEPLFVRIIRICIAYEYDSEISIRTNFTEKVRMIFINLDAYRTSKCSTKTMQLKYKCLNINKTIDHLNLHDLAEMRNASIISITAVPILFKLGARPIHSVTIRRAVDNESWLLSWQMLFAMVSIISVVIAWFDIAICIIYIRQSRTANTTDERPAIELSSMPMQTLEQDNI